MQVLGSITISIQCHRDRVTSSGTYLVFVSVFQVFEGTSGIDNKFTTVQFTGEIIFHTRV